MLLNALKAAIGRSAEAASARSAPDKRDARADAVLQQEAANADFIRSHAEAIRTDTKLRAIIVTVLCGLVIVTVLGVLVLAVLQALHVVGKSDLLMSVAGPGGVVIALLVALELMLRRR